MIEQFRTWYRRFSAWDSMLYGMITLAAAGVLRHGLAKTAPQLAGALVAATVVELIAIRLRFKKIVLPKSALITALITATVLPLGAAAWKAALVVALTLAVKHFVRPMGKHIFNPAALAIVVSGILFKIHPGWWSESYLPLTIVLGLYVTYRIRKWWQVVSYLIAYGIIGFAIVVYHEGLSSLQFTIPYWIGVFSGVPWFFALFMVPEPRTSPGARTPSIIFGALAAIVGATVPIFTPIINGLLAANMYNHLQQWYVVRRLQRA